MKYFFTGLLFVGICLMAQQRLSFREALSRIPGGSAELKIERYKLGYSEADIIAARIRHNPIFNNQYMNMTNSNSWAPGTNAFNNRNRQLWCQLTKPVMINNIRGKRIDLAEKGKTIVELEIEEKKRHLLYQCGLRWIDLWISDIDMKVLKLAQGYLDTLVIENEKKIKSNSITQEELLRTKLLSDQIEIRLMSMQQDYENQLNQMQEMLGISDSIYIEDNLLDMTIPIPSLDSLLEYALKNRSDFIMEKENIEIRKSNHTLQQASRAPFMEFGVIYTPQNGHTYAGTFATIAIPVFDRNQDDI